MVDGDGREGRVVDPARQPPADHREVPPPRLAGSASPSTSPPAHSSGRGRSPRARRPRQSPARRCLRHMIGGRDLASVFQRQDFRQVRIEGWRCASIVVRGIGSLFVAARAGPSALIPNCSSMCRWSGPGCGFAVSAAAADCGGAGGRRLVPVAAPAAAPAGVAGCCERLGTTSDAIENLIMMAWSTFGRRSRRMDDARRILSHMEPVLAMAVCLFAGRTLANLRVPAPV